MRKNLAINPDETSREFKADLSRRLKKAENPKNRIPINEFFRRRESKQKSQKVEKYAAV